MNDKAGCESLIEFIRNAERKGDLPRALRLTEEGIRQFPASAELFAFRAHALLGSGKLEEAQAAAQKAVELGQESPYALAAMANILAFNGDLDQAKQLADRAYEINDTDPFVLEKCLSVSSLLNDPDRSIALAQRWRELHPEDDHAFALSIASFKVAGKPAEAAELFAEAERKFPDSPWILMRRGEAYVQERRMDMAIDTIKQVIEQIPNSQHAWAQLALWLSHARRTEEAEAAVNRALELNQRSSLAMMAMANICRLRGQDKKAAKWDKQASEAIPVMRANSIVREAIAAMRKGDWEDALKLADREMDGLSGHFRANCLNLKARIYLDHDMIAEAEDAVAQLRALGYQPNIVAAYESRLLLGRGDLDGAINSARAGIAGHPVSGELRGTLLRALHAKGSFEEEEIEIKRAFANLPQAPTDFIFLAIALDDIGCEAEAREMTALGLEKFPGTEELMLFQAMDSFKIGDMNGARSKVKDIKGQMSDAAGILEHGASIIDRIRQIGEQIQRKKPGGKPPTLN